MVTLGANGLVLVLSFCPMPILSYLVQPGERSSMPLAHLFWRLPSTPLCLGLQYAANVAGGSL